MRRPIPPAVMRAGLAVFVSLAAAVPAAAAPPRPVDPGRALRGLDAFVAEEMKQAKAPGMAVAVVRDGRLVLARGYGFRDFEGRLAVTPRTIFAIGSITKSFTVTGLGMLVDEGRLDWDRPVREYLPDFRMFDPVATEGMTPRDLVTHRSGLPRHDLLWYQSNWSRAEMFGRLRHLEPSRGFRSAFQYNNLMFMTAGHLAERLTGSTWEALTRERILRPLGMDRTNFSVNDSQKSDDFARPYQKVKDEVKRIPFADIDQVGPAGSINSSVEEMARYLMFQLDGGTHAGRRLLSEANAIEMQTPQMVEPGAIKYPEIGHEAYGLGFRIGSYRGHKTVSHGGGIDGFMAWLSFMPQDRIGMVILVNMDWNGGSNLPVVVEGYVYDRLLGLDVLPWSRRFREEEAKAKAAGEEAKQKGYTLRRAGTVPSHPLPEYAGEYAHAGYGVVRIALEGQDLRLTYNRLSSPLRHFHYDTFEVPEDPLDPLSQARVTFVPDAKGEIATLLVPMEPRVGEVGFLRQPERRMREKAFLLPLAGAYDFAGDRVTVALQGEETLVLQVPGQPERLLVPVRGTLFDLKGLTGYSVEFKADPGGTVVEAIFYQPDGTYVAKRLPDGTP